MLILTFNENGAYMANQKIDTEKVNLKNDSAICCLQQAHFKCNNNTGRLKIQGLEKIHYVNIIKRKQEWLYVYQIKLT